MLKNAMPDLPTDAVTKSSYCFIQVIDLRFVFPNRPNRFSLPKMACSRSKETSFLWLAVGADPLSAHRHRGLSGWKKE
jgi:hypothetical protein